MEYRAGMFVYALAFLLGVVCVQQLTVLPSQIQLFIVFIGFFLFRAVFHLVVCRFLSVFVKEFTLISNVILLFIIGFTVASLFANDQLSYRLNEDLIGKDLLVVGYVSSIPTTDKHVQRFELTVENHQIIGANKLKQNNSSLATTEKFPRKIRLSWYYGRPVSAAEQWQLEVRLKPPHGFSNPGGFDYEGWLFQHGLHATGYVRKSANNLQKPTVGNTSLLAAITGYRQALGQQIDDIANQKGIEPGSFALIKALAIGDKSSISKQQWRVLSATGTSHLMAISGLHIGLAALFAYFIIRRVIPAYLVKRIPAQHVSLAGGLFVALIYALIAGFSVPTQRAFIMLFILSVMVLIRRNHRPVDALGFALIIVLLIDPLAVLSAGFWFSFSAVAVIFISLNFTDAEPSQQQTSLVVSFCTKAVSLIKKWVRLQLLISIFLLPLSLFMFQQVSLVSPLANLLLIPYVSFLIVPLVLLAMCLSFIFPAVAEFLFKLSASLLDIVWSPLSSLSAQPYALWVQGEVGVFKLLSVTAALGLLYFSRPITNVIVGNVSNQQLQINQRQINQRQTKVYWSLVFISVMMFVPLFISDTLRLNAGEYKISVLDVGQGSAAVVQTQNHVVVFDAGAKYSDKLDAGSSVVIPYLRSQGIRSIDKLIISHGDNDHIGGAQAIIDAYPSVDVVGQEIDSLQAENKQDCIAGLKWQWDGISFEFLSPDNEETVSLTKAVRNNLSCVLSVSSKSGTALLTGDIEKKVETHLLEKHENRLESDVLVVPHHGSRTSSSQGFIDAVDPKIAIISVGYKNRYKLPSSKIISRYHASDSTILRTDNSGEITILLSEEEGIQVDKYRDKAKKYWHHEVN